MQTCNSGNGQELSRNDINKLHKHLLTMYRDVEKVCSKHGIKICLAYGNVIGALRHNGWIPWDDDMDIHMSRKDYDNFLTLYASELPSRYIVSSYLSKGGSKARFAKIIDTSTTYVPIDGEKDEESGVFLDIFPIDSIPNQPIRNKIRRAIALFLMFTANSVKQFQESSPKYKSLMFLTKNGRQAWRLRQFWGAIFSIINYRKWHAAIERFGINKESETVHIMASSKFSYKPLPKSMFFPFREITLPELGTVMIPNKANEYLTTWYGNWEIVPDDKDKWHHYVSEFYIS